MKNTQNDTDDNFFITTAILTLKKKKKSQAKNKYVTYYLTENQHCNISQEMKYVRTPHRTSKK